MKVKQLISELIQFPMDLNVNIFQEKDTHTIKEITIVINDGEPQCGIMIK